MLNVYFGPMPEAIYNTAVYFKNTNEDKWITAPLAVEMIADVDRSKVVGPQAGHRKPGARYDHAPAALRRRRDAAADRQRQDG